MNIFSSACGLPIRMVSATGSFDGEASRAMRKSPPNSLSQVARVAMWSTSPSWVETAIPWRRCVCRKELGSRLPELATVPARLAASHMREVTNSRTKSVGTDRSFTTQLTVLLLMGENCRDRKYGSCYPAIHIVHGLQAGRTGLATNFLPRTSVLSI